MEGLSGVKTIIKSMVLSYNENLTVDKLGRLYESSEGEFIPYKKFGYKNLDSFLRSIPDSVKVSFMSFLLMMMHFFHGIFSSIYRLLDMVHRRWLHP